MTKYECPHVKNKEREAISIATHRTIPGAPTRADDLGTETKLCTVCSGLLIGTLARLEEGTYKL